MRFNFKAAFFQEVTVPPEQNTTELTTEESSGMLPQVVLTRLHWRDFLTSIKSILKIKCPDCNMTILQLQRSKKGACQGEFTGVHPA